VNRYGWLVALAGSLSQVAFADDMALHFDSKLSLRTDVWSGSSQLDDTGAVGQGSVWGETKLKLSEQISFVGSAWARAQTPSDPDVPAGRLRELYWRYRGDVVDVKLGRQMVVWGRADGLNPTDNLSPRDFTLLAPEDGDLRYGNEAAQVSVTSSVGVLTGLYFPSAASHTIALAPQQGVNYQVSEPPRTSQWGMKWDGSSEGVDGSISYFDGVDPMPDINYAGVAPTGLNIAVRNHAARYLGADISLVSNGVVWRAEAAWMQTQSAGRQDFTHKKPQFWLVGGAEWSLASSTTLGIQGTFQQVMNFESPDTLVDPLQREVAWRQAATSSQTAEYQTGMTWRLATRWRNDTVTTEVNGVLVFTSQSGLWRTKLDFALDDHWSLQGGTVYYFGPERSFFGQLHKNQLIYVQLRYGW
jgi:hypothetical protein